MNFPHGSYQKNYIGVMLGTTDSINQADCITDLEGGDNEIINGLDIESTLDNSTVQDISMKPDLCRGIISSDKKYLIFVVSSD